VGLIERETEVTDESIKTAKKNYNAWKRLS
jgi:hypothetical protein